MKQAFYAITSGVILAALSVLSLGAHSASAAPMSMEPMNAAHGPSVSSCFTACITATVQKKDIVNDVEKKDEEPEPPYYTQFQTSSLAAFDIRHTQEARFAIDSLIPPDKLPAYIKLTVFRA